MKHEYMVTFYDDEDAEHQHALPGKLQVCSDCEGSGYVLRPSIRYHAYSVEEFNESYADEEDRAEYFKRGGRYDVQCQTCKGRNVEVVPDEERIAADPEHAAAFAKFLALCEDRAASDREYAAERRAGA